MTTQLLVTVALAIQGAAAAGKEANHDVSSNPNCGGYTLYVGLKALDAGVGDYKELEQKLGGPSPAGYSLGQLAEAAESYGMRTLGVQTSVENLERRPGRFVCIAHIRGNHFVNVANVEGGVVSLIDPPRTYELPAATFNTQWNGTALLISPQTLLREEDLPRPFPWRRLLAVPVLALLCWTGWVLLRRVTRARQS